MQGGLWSKLGAKSSNAEWPRNAAFQSRNARDPTNQYTTPIGRLPTRARRTRHASSVETGLRPEKEQRIAA